MIYLLIGRGSFIMEAVVLYYKCCELITMKNEGIGVLNIYICCVVVKGLSKHMYL